MSLLSAVSCATGTIEGLLALCAALAGASGAVRFCRDDAVEGTVLVALMVLGAFCLVALDAARRGAGL